MLFMTRFNGREGGRKGVRINDPDVRFRHWVVALCVAKMKLMLCRLKQNQSNANQRTVGGRLGIFFRICGTEVMLMLLLSE